MSHALVQATLAVGEALAKLALARGAALEREAAQVYLEDLADLPPGLVVDACQALRREAKAEYEPAMPTVGTIRARVETVKRERENRVRALPPAPNERTYRCQDCEDEPSGWRYWQCPGRDVEGPQRVSEKAVKNCGKFAAHPPHAYVTRCVCWLRRNAERLEYSRQQAIQKGTPIPRECDALAALGPR